MTTCLNKEVSGSIEGSSEWGIIVFCGDGSAQIAKVSSLSIASSAHHSIRQRLRIYRSFSTRYYPRVWLLSAFSVPTAVAFSAMISAMETSPEGNVIYSAVGSYIVILTPFFTSSSVRPAVAPVVAPSL